MRKASQLIEGAIPLAATTYENPKLKNQSGTDEGTDAMPQDFIAQLLPKTLPRRTAYMACIYDPHCRKRSPDQ